MLSEQKMTNIKTIHITRSAENQCDVLIFLAEHKCNAADRIPNKIHVEMNPKTNATWNMIQEMAFNPRLKLMLKPNRTLSSVITYLSQKWKSHRLKLVSFYQFNSMKSH